MASEKAKAAAPASTRAAGGEKVKGGIESSR
jgi:hypothetical protein